MPTITLDELDREGRVVCLPAEHSAALSATGLVEVRLETPSQCRILTRGKVGAARVGDLQVQVAPKDKVGLTQLLFLLGYASDPGFRPENVFGAEQQDLWPVLAESLSRLGERATGTGVLQGYHTVDESLRTIRGRIRIGDQISRRPGFTVPVEVTYDEFTADIPENQILRSAVRRMLAVPRLSRSATARLSHLDGRLAEALVLAPGARLPDWQSTRLNERYQPALRLSSLILGNASAEASNGKLQVAAFVVDMAKVFEDFVGTALTESLRRYPGVTRLQYPAHLDEVPHGRKPAIRMYPDVAHLVHGQPRLVFDAKYKASSAGDRYPNADHYQMLAYSTALQVPTAWLVYAGGTRPSARRIRNTNVEIIEYPLDLRLTPQELLGHIDILAHNAWHRKESKPAVA